MTLKELWQNSFKNHSEKEAIVTESERLTYQELDQEIKSFQLGLKRLGIQKGEHIGLLLPNCPEFIIAYLGIACMGNTVVPLNPTLTVDELTYIIEDASIRTLICFQPLQGLVQALQKKRPSLKNIIVTPQTTQTGWISFTELTKKRDKSVEVDESISPDEIAAILYTSGTTGKPKGAMLMHKNLCSNAVSAYETLACNHNDRFLVSLPLFHSFQATVGMLVPILGSCKMVIVKDFKPQYILELIEKEKLTIFLGVPSMYLLLTRTPKEEKEPSSFFRLCVSGGAALPVTVANEFEKRFHLPIHEGYGLTEASPVCSVNPIHEPPKIGSIGKPLKGVKIKVVDENEKEVPVGEVGELLVNGENVMKGYLGLPEETKQTIRNNWLHTGDMAKQDEEGYFYIVDRKKEMIIVAGENVYPREVEEVLYQHPDVAETAVIGIPDQLRGEVPRAFVRLKENAPENKKEILSFCREHLASYKIPKTIRFIKEFPKNATGKILKKELSSL